MEYASTHPAPPPWVNAVPLLLIITVMEIILYRLARRKGRYFLPYFFLGLIPGVNFITVLVLASQTDAAVWKEIDELRTQVELLKANSQAASVPPPIPPKV